MVMPYHLHMPSYFLETFTEYPKNKNKESSQAVPYKPTNISRINNNK